MAGLMICGTGRALPAAALSADALDTRLNLPAGSMVRMTGVETRYVCADETQIDLAVTAAHAALDDAGMAAGDVDLILSAAAVPYQSIPATAPLIQHRLGIADATCFAMDVNATCLGFPAALHMADGLVQVGAYRAILIVAAEVASRGLPWDTQPEVAGLFGDGAGAAIVTRGPGTGLRAAAFATYPSTYDACTLGAGGTRFDYVTDRAGFDAHSTFSMDGKALFRVAAAHFAPFIADLLAKADTAPDQIDHVIAHQASPGGLAHMIKASGFDPARVTNIVADVGNQIAASIPFALDVARKSGAITPGQRIALLGTSAGVSFGGLVLDI